MISFPRAKSWVTKPRPAKNASVLTGLPTKKVANLAAVVVAVVAVVTATKKVPAANTRLVPPNTMLRPTLTKNPSSTMSSPKWRPLMTNMATASTTTSRAAKIAPRVALLATAKMARIAARVVAVVVAAAEAVVVRKVPKLLAPLRQHAAPIAMHLPAMPTIRISRKTLKADLSRSVPRLPRRVARSANRAAR